MFPVTITIHNEAQLQEVVAAMRALALKENAPAKVEKPTPVKEEPKAEAPKPVAEKPAQSSGTTSAPSAPAPDSSAPSDTGASTGKTIDDAKALTMKLVASKGRDVAVGLLQKFGVPVAAKLSADQIDAFCAEAEELLK